MKQKLKQNNDRLSEDLLLKHIGDHIIFTVESPNNNICSGIQKAYDGKFLEINGFKQHKMTLIDAIERPIEEYNPNNPSSIEYSLPTHKINANLITSLDLYDDVIKAKK